MDGTRLDGDAVRLDTAEAAAPAGASGRAVDVDALSTLLTQRVELPSWAFRGADPRFSSHVAPGAPRTCYELLADAAVVHRFTGITPEIGLHLGVDQVDDHGDLATHAAELGVGIGSVHPDVNLRHGRPPAVCHPDADLRRRAAEHLREAAWIASEVGARRLVLRLVDDTPYPGAAEARARQQRLGEALTALRDAMPPAVRLVVEYVVVEPCFYTRDVPDWSTAYAQCLPLGANAQVLVDTAHYAQATPVDFVVGLLMPDDRLGGVVLRSPAPNDLDGRVVSAPFDLFLALAEVAYGGALVAGKPLAVPFVLDPGGNRLPGILPLIEAVLAVQEATARAATLDLPAWRAAQEAGDHAAANAVLLDGYQADVTPLLQTVRVALEVPVDPVEAYHEVCRAELRDAERRAAVQRLVARRVAVLLGPNETGWAAWPS
jgi:L-rhamnose isomerase/sugar isomerase